MDTEGPTLETEGGQRASSELTAGSGVGPPDCLSTPVILRHILEQFSNSELLKLSLVNKEWNFEARSVMRNRGNLIANKFPHDLCQSLAAFASDLGKMRVVPFSGIDIELSHCEPCRLSHEGLDPSCNVIMERLQWKQLNVWFMHAWKNNHVCPAFALARKILDARSATLEKVSLNLDDQAAEWFGKRLKNWKFSRLQTLTFEANCVEESSTTNLVKALVASAPNLQELRWENYNFKGNVLEGSSAVLVPDSAFNPLYQQVCESFRGALRLESVQIYVGETEDYDKELLNRFVPNVLQTSHASLKTVGMDLLFAVPLICYRICLENVTKFKIRTCSGVLESLQQPLSTILQGFDFTRIFPKLTQARILNHHFKLDAYDFPRRRFFSASDVSGFVERGRSGLQNTLPDRAVNIKQLTMQKSIWESFVPFWAQMFPHVNTLSLETDGERFPFHDLLEYFGNLEELNISWDNSRPLTVENLDSAFCGIFPAEIYELRRKDDEYLKAVNIVPVMPSISCMRGLRSLTCKYTPEYCFGERTDSTLIFSKVTAWIGFARCPALTVTLEANSKTVEGLRHMEPYVNFVVNDASSEYESDDDD